ncbi:MAG: hypothetical protein NTW69_00935, partial [Chloroflexi bacterium]|nr:hypothetical protein [Chloroflexota bacterium]
KIKMDNELKNIEIETARIRLERERLALQDEVDKRQRSQRSIERTQNAVETAQAVGVAASVATINLFQIILISVIGGAIAALIGLVWVAKTKWDGNSFDLAYSYGYWLGNGGWIPILIFAISSPFFYRGKNAIQHQENPINGPPKETIFERRVKLKRQFRLLVVTSSFVGVGWLLHEILPTSIREFFGGVLAMATVALPFWGIGLLIDYFRIAALRRH